jgi:hypothetical protein
VQAARLGVPFDVPLRRSIHLNTVTLLPITAFIPGMKAAIVTLVVGAWLTFAGATWAYLPVVHEATSTTMSPSAFGRALAGAANEFGGPTIVNVHCVAGDPGNYMCSYAVQRRSGRLECHLMQGSWSQSTLEIDVTLAGRTRRCATLRDAVHSLV